MKKTIGTALIGVSALLFAASMAVNAAPPKKEAAPAPAVAAPSGAKTVTIQSGAAASGANTFNRLLKKPEKQNAPPPEDGIHDAENDNTFVLQPPKVAFESLPQAEWGNYVNWVNAIQDSKVKPRTDKLGTGEAPMVMDLDIIREVKSTVPDLVFPHKAHTEWLDCSNCHPDVFIPQQGANVMNMSQILLGQKCGVCHGKVSFPVTTKTCKLCHAKSKPDGWQPPKSSASVDNPWK